MQRRSIECAVLCLSLTSLIQHVTAAEEPSSERPTVAIVGQENKSYNSLQESLDEHLALEIGSSRIVHELGLAELQGISMRSSWPITAAESAMIPDDGSVGYEKWKKRPKLESSD